MLFDDKMMKALALDAQKLESMEMPQPSIADVFHCKRCGSSGEAIFSWDGVCLICEDGDEDHLAQEEHPSMISKPSEATCK